MLKRRNYPKELLDSVGDGMKGELQLLRYEYKNRNAELDKKIDCICKLKPDFPQMQMLKAGLASDRAELIAGIEHNIEVMDRMEIKVKEGLLSLLDEQVVADVASHELEVLNGLTAMQRINSASLKRVFDLNLPALAKEQEVSVASALREAMVLLMEDTQFMSNEMQDMAVFIKERNKVITHPIDEDHP